jgi:hypothetical protein
MSSVINFKKFGSVYPGEYLVSSSSPARNDSILVTDSLFGFDIRANN